MLIKLNAIYKYKKKTTGPKLVFFGYINTTGEQVSFTSRMRHVCNKNNYCDRKSAVQQPPADEVINGEKNKTYTYSIINTFYIYINEKYYLLKITYKL